MNDDDRERLVRIEEGVKHLCSSTKDQESRIRGLEQSRGLAAGAIAFILAFKAVSLKIFQTLLGGP